MTHNMKQIIGTHNLLFITLDTLRFDIAQHLLQTGQTPNLANLVVGASWEERHTPGNFTFAAHAAFFAGFLPTPASPGNKTTRLFASRFAGSETTGSKTFVFEEPDLVSALRNRNYHTVCIGGVGFFNKQCALGSIFPNLFHESHWSRETGVTDPHSAQNQFNLAGEILRSRPASQKTFLFINVSAIHQPNHFYLKEATHDSLETHAAALKYVDSTLPILINELRNLQQPTFYIICSDHGTAYGEEGYFGHRLGHPSVWTVPYCEGIIQAHASRLGGHT